MPVWMIPLLAVRLFTATTAFSIHQIAVSPSLFVSRVRFSYRRPFVAIRTPALGMTETKADAPPSSVLNDPMGCLPQPLLLGSASFTRKLILREMGVNFAIVVRPIDESSIGSRENDTPETLVRTLSHAKMDHLLHEIEQGHCDADIPGERNRQNGWVVLTADQVVTCNEKILEKPVDVNEAKEFVARYGQYPCSTVGHVVVTHLPSRISVSSNHVATIYFKETLTAAAASDLVDALVQNGEPILSCAGGLMIEHPLTRNHVERIDGSEDSVMGLCKETVATLLSELQTQLVQGGHLQSKS